MHRLSSIKCNDHRSRSNQYFGRVFLYQLPFIPSSPAHRLRFRRGNHLLNLLSRGGVVSPELVEPILCRNAEGVNDYCLV